MLSLLSLLFAVEAVVAGFEPGLAKCTKVRLLHLFYGTARSQYRGTLHFVLLLNGNQKEIEAQKFFAGDGHPHINRRIEAPCIFWGGHPKKRPTP